MLLISYNSVLVFVLGIVTALFNDGALLPVTWVGFGLVFWHGSARLTDSLEVLCDFLCLFFAQWLVGAATRTALLLGKFFNKHNNISTRYIFLIIYHPGDAVVCI